MEFSNTAECGLPQYFIAVSEIAIFNRKGSCFEANTVNAFMKPLVLFVKGENTLTRGT